MSPFRVLNPTTPTSHPPDVTLKVRSHQKRCELFTRVDPISKVNIQTRTVAIDANCRRAVSSAAIANIRLNLKCLNLAGKIARPRVAKANQR